MNERGELAMMITGKRVFLVGKSIQRYPASGMLEEQVVAYRKGEN